MNTFIVTYKLDKNPDHDPANKVTGRCPLTGLTCTDVTGEHHTRLVESPETAEQLADRLRHEGNHITRVEEAQWSR